MEREEIKEVMWVSIDKHLADLLTKDGFKKEGIIAYVTGNEELQERER